VFHPPSTPILALRAPRGRPLALALAGLISAALACARAPAPTLTHEAYVWQRDWTPEVSAAVAGAPAALGALRVLAAERSGTARRPVESGVDVEALLRAARPVVAVLRVDGTARLDGIALDAAVVVARRWRARGVAVRGIEVDHDCATAHLAAYAAWLRAQRAVAGDLPLSITALPAWAASGADLRALLETVDAVTLQVHTVRAPSLFEAAEARGWVERWAKLTGRPFAVALPTYRAYLATGATVEASAPEVARFLRGLEQEPVAGVTGVAWFRLGNAGDRDAWSARTLAAVIARGPLRPAIRAVLVPAAGGALDVAVENTGDADGSGPARLAIEGAVEDLERVRGYPAQGATLVAAPPPRLRAGERFVIGWIRGRGVSLAAAP
jgi:hypothetical protein